MKQLNRFCPCRLSLSFLLFFTAVLLHAQPGSLDTSFDPGTEANNDIQAIVIHSDGRILIGGDFTTYNETSVMVKQVVIR